MIRVLQVYDSTAINAGINIEIMNWNRNIRKEICRFDFLSSWKKTPNFDAEIEKLGGRSYYIEEGEGIGEPVKFINKVKKFMKLNARSYDIIHLHSGPLCYPYLYYAKKYGVKTRIVHAHSLSSGNTRLSSCRNNLLMLPMRRLATDFFACSGEAAQRWFVSRGIHDFCIMNNGIDLEKYRYSENDRESLRKELGFNDENRVILHVSNMSRLKNVPFVIEVFRRINGMRNDCRLLLAGKESLPDSIVSLIRKHGLEDRVVNYGVTNDVARVINGSDLCVMPSKTEGFGLVPVECQSCKKNVIISEGFPEVIDATPFVRRLPLDLNKWVEKSVELLDKIKIPDSADNDRQLQMFDIKKVTDNLTEKYMFYANRESG